MNTSKTMNEITAEQIGSMRARAIEDVRMAREDAAAGGPLTAEHLNDVEMLYGPSNASPEELAAWRRHAVEALEPTPRRQNRNSR